MTRFRSTLARWHKRREGRPVCQKRALGKILCTGANFSWILFAAFWLTSNNGFGQTTRTNPSAAPTIKSIPFSSSTSPNNPCSNANPTSPCYSANAPKNPCYSAAAPDDPCPSATSTGSPVSPPPKPVVATHHSAELLTVEQAKAKIETEGYANVSGLQKDAKGGWRGKATKNGLPVNVNLGADGKVTQQQIRRLP